ncbi:phosphoenolpyruvate mutase [Pantoea allii]|uniref:phosphoenolpyruvate mutase n=2 Tax=Pantoea TaxID=53335 RepID=A0ABS6VDV4_9GAMM|nr:MULTISPECIES: phosphoenolpyruvate mutase [Pantoea]MBW1213774.1 phosphoenolpyruvate mutase [Pantoea allii]MBW1251835.1 phosphoenolpyruvate mutase [Pantoea allii]MBW1256983.1 phosphoenolpyruvate mutase [Pantoea allii]MBW1260432.1 phosphoenolpyruvate mutase [Pantoea allii]MBW1266060.1 phosphoenolpyruvate mutase [Pantoea allii]
MSIQKRLARGEYTQFMEAHNGLSAKIVEHAGFEAIWASGLSISAAMGLSDRNEASWSQVINALEQMADNTSIPILVDGDSGFGNYLNVMRFVKKLKQININAMCIEDKMFPKVNSFIGENQALAPVSEFCNKIRAAKDTGGDEFTVVARIEALISGHPMEEALERAEAYKDAGADAILIHSKKSDAGEVFTFSERWGGKLPLFAVPTKYYNTEYQEFVKHGVTNLIWANHLIRSSVRSMKETADRIYKEKSLINVEKNVSSLDELFSLTTERYMDELEAKYNS